MRRRAPGDVSPAQLTRLAAAAPALVRASRRAPAGQGPHTSFRVRVMGEQEPSAASRLVLARTTDRLGVPHAELTWRLSDLDVRSMVEGHHLVAASLGGLLGGRVVTLLGPDGEPRPQGGAHHMGTTRMSAVPRHGVVDPSCRVHGVRNLYVAGSSVFPTSGAANPTLTLVALAARLARHLSRELMTPSSRQAPPALGSSR